MIFHSLDTKVWVFIILVIISLITGLVFGAKMLTTWDSVQFALGVEHYDISHHQPHPPGYVLWVAVLKPLYYLGIDPNKASQIINSIFEGLAAFILFYILTRFFRLSYIISILISITSLFSPLMWWYRAIAENYASGAFFTVLFVYLVLDLIDNVKDYISRKKLVIAAYILGFSGGFRIELPVFLLPILIYIVYRILRIKSVNMGSMKTKVTIIILVLLSYTIGVLTWLIPQIILSGGLLKWITLTLNQFRSRVAHTCIGTAPILKIRRETVRSITLLLGGNGLNILIIIPLLTGLINIKNINRKELEYYLIVLGGLLPFFIFTSLIHLGKAGYLLPAMVLLSIFFFSFKVFW